MAGVWLQRAAVIANISIVRKLAVCVTVAGKPSDDVAPGTMNSILQQAGLKDR
jgi:hypothetical protein